MNLPANLSNGVDVYCWKEVILSVSAEKLFIPERRNLCKIWRKFRKDALWFGEDLIWRE